jgi:hypothetical protein
MIQQIQDQAGRWSDNIYQLKTRMKLALISLYQVVKHNATGITSVHSQQIAWLHKCSWLEDQKSSLLRDLKVALQTSQQDNVSVREDIAARVMRFAYVKGNENLSAILTKPLSNVLTKPCEVLRQVLQLLFMCIICMI